jgi:outer membrane protein assembly factor BamB
VRSLSILADGNILVAYLETGLVACNLDTGEEIWRLTPNSFRMYVIPPQRWSAHPHLDIGRGRAAVDDLSRFVVCTNLCDGMDIYDIQLGAHLQTVRLPIRENIALPAKFIYEGSHVLVGSASGRVRIVSVPKGLLVDELEHGNDSNNGMYSPSSLSLVT